MPECCGMHQATFRFTHPGWLSHRQTAAVLANLSTGLPGGDVKCVVTQEGRLALPQLSSVAPGHMGKDTENAHTQNGGSSHSSVHRAWVSGGVRCALCDEPKQSGSSSTCGHVS